jgi:hypothetical protein
VTAALVVAIIVLGAATAFSFAHAGSSKMSAEETRASNARVLREYRRMAIHSPEKIIDYRPERSGRAQRTHDT